MDAVDRFRNLRELVKLGPDHFTHEERSALKHIVLDATAPASVNGNNSNSAATLNANAAAVSSDPPSGKNSSSNDTTKPATAAAAAAA
eukprot:CAMPEP_0175031712 /NCGR_PEP_ID=MMETSP0005-20121125/20992_1 /TAXON_ID=420556 /ORGANISM="Ochromonas sp., Strain CCMP1393" /LENGTH=87 /DNA_ID=CAMNT_0016292041 /DNA_START=20 /DNA_END=280 /DNA_ORIENTATION=+